MGAMTPQLKTDPDSTTPANERAPSTAPREAILDLLRSSGGRLPERRLVMETPLTTDGCRRVLDELRAAGEVSCRETGCERVVCLRDADPTTSR